MGEQTPTDLISEYVAAFKAANTMNDPPAISFFGGWYTFKTPRTPPRKYRRHVVEEMRDRLLERAKAGAS